MRLKEITSTLNSLFKIQQAEGFDNVGLLCGNPEREISKILVTHDVLPHIVDEAVEANANLIVCFHPIIFSGLKSITGKNYVEKTVLQAIENKIAIYAIHTAFDNDYFGVNYKICEHLGLKNQKILQPKTENLQQLTTYVPSEYAEQVSQALFDANAGNIGFYKECSFTVSGTGTYTPTEGSQPFLGKVGIKAFSDEKMISVIFEKYKQNQVLQALKKNHPYEEVAYQIYSLENENQFSGLGRVGELERELEEKEFLQLLKSKFHLSVIKHSAFTGKKIKKIGVLGGSGASGIAAAMAHNCDAYVSGDFKYHDFFRAENQILLCDIGHFESEQFVSQQLFDILSENFPKFAILKTHQNTNPVNYFF